MTSAYGNLAEVAYLKRDTTGLTYSFIGYNLGQKYKNTRATFIGAGHLAQFFLLKGNLTEAEKYINVYMGIAAKNGYDKSFGHLLSSRVLTQQGNLDMAEREAAKALALARESLNSMVPECLVQHATVLARKGNYSKSNEELEEALHTSNEMSIHQFVVEIYTLMSRNYEKMGNIRSALAYSQAALDTAQSISISDKQHILSERDLAMQLVQKEQEAILYKQKLRSHRNVSIMLTVTAALLLTLFIFVAISLHRRNVLYKNIVRQNRAAIGKEKEMKRQIQELKDKSIQSGTQELTDGSGDLQRIKTDNMEAEGSSTLKSATLDKLYDRLCSMMESERLYTDNQLNRDTLAKMLGTNHTYLTKVIMQKTQMSYPQYINSYRINDAIRVLSDPNQPDYPLKQLCFDLGFNSQSTFHKLFKAQVGLSPSAYRDFVKKA